MKWIVICLALAGLSTSASAILPCPPPMVLDQSGSCVCPPGGCSCAPPAVRGANNSCTCPQNTHKVTMAHGPICVRNCRPGTYQPPNGKTCIKCQRGYVVNTAGQCVCPPGLASPAGGNSCFPCAPPKIIDFNDVCVCPPGTGESQNLTCVPL